MIVLMKEIVIIGAGGFGREVQWLIERINEQQKKETGEIPWKICGYIDDGISVGTKVDGYEVLGGMDYLCSYRESLGVVCAIGSSSTRRRVLERILHNEHLHYPNLIDPSVIMSDRVELGKGNIICVGSILTVDIQIDDFCIINLDCTLGHDDILESFVTIYPSVNISGCVSIGVGAEIGTGAQIIQGKQIGEGTIIGAGSVVVRDIGENCTAVGNPCKPIKFYRNLTSENTPKFSVGVKTIKSF